MTDFNLDEHYAQLLTKFPKDSYFTKDILDNVRNALLEGNYWTRIDTVAKSGMSRTIVCCYAKVDNGKPSFRYVDPVILSIFAGVDRTGRISGCGMDMLFAVQHSLFRALCPDKKYQTDMPRYNTLP